MCVEIWEAGALLALLALLAVALLPRIEFRPFFLASLALQAWPLLLQSPAAAAAAAAAAGQVLV